MHICTSVLCMTVTQRMTHIPYQLSRLMCAARGRLCGLPSHYRARISWSQQN
jgi:hypothetical protein